MLACILNHSFLPTFLISYAINKIGSSNVAIIGSVGPVSTILQAHYFLGEPIILAQLIGTVLVIGGVVLIGLKSRQPELPIS